MDTLQEQIRPSTDRRKTDGEFLEPRPGVVIQSRARAAATAHEPPERERIAEPELHVRSLDGSLAASVPIATARGASEPSSFRPLVVKVTPLAGLE